MHPNKIPNMAISIVMCLCLFSYALYPKTPNKKYSITCNNLSHVRAKTVGTDFPGIDEPIKINKRYRLYCSYGRAKYRRFLG